MSAGPKPEWNGRHERVNRGNAFEAQMTDRQELAPRMIAKADADHLGADHPLRTLAAELDEATRRFFSVPQTCDVRRFVSCWARARRAWCEYTGESLL